MRGCNFVLRVLQEHRCIDFPTLMHPPREATESPQLVDDLRACFVYNLSMGQHGCELDPRKLIFHTVAIMV